MAESHEIVVEKPRKGAEIGTGIENSKKEEEKGEERTKGIAA